MYNIQLFYNIRKKQRLNCGNVIVRDSNYVTFSTLPMTRSVIVQRGKLILTHTGAHFNSTNLGEKSLKNRETS